MRTAFFQALEDHAQPQTVFITGDLGFGVINGFLKKHPEKFINAGVAEQNLIGLSAGMALAGKKVFAYSIANFNTLRPLEQIRNDVAYHKLNVTVVSVGGGLAYGSLGISHHATEDLAILRSIPNMTVFAPGDTKEAYELTKRIICEDLGPVYLRLGRAGEATLHTDESVKKLVIGKAFPLIETSNRKLAILSTGGMLETAVKVCEQLKQQNIQSSVFSYHTIKPFDIETTRRIFKEYELVVSLEEHSIIGGFSAAILESLVGSKGITLDNYLPFALPTTFTSKVGDQNYLRNLYNISPEKILEKILNTL
ncbi:MAG TPA: transketolase C-terminal domain-containing protein [Bacteroidales bacterium]|jgi:transketolase|nr:transketolase [Bacteroidales bacterium]HNZ42462.1 transketolase C-terminal domain-containing protein [Bacteroidales bacterium]HOH84155.1 transketolase C-terminal domain-containing protein [Bacteroidales bacterium]HPB24158.1 transketolase C-terminal domain-containing protein [Bacteroidales bacterium]HPI29566.1 transketolase C-terminal domain-containing protein [Bacteroidales bacterium]